MVEGGFLTIEILSVRNSWFSKRPCQPLDAMQFKICNTASEGRTVLSLGDPIQLFTGKVSWDSHPMVFYGMG